MLGEDAPAIGVDFAEGDGSHSGSFKAKAKPSNAGKKIENVHIALHSEMTSA